MTRYAIHTPHGYVAGIFCARETCGISYCVTRDFALTWPSMSEASLAMSVHDIEGEIEAVER